LLILLRLNSQHNIHIKVQGGHLLHPSIPKADIKTVADIATGTGYIGIKLFSHDKYSLTLPRIWLEDVRTELAEAGNKQDLELVGFDISDVQWNKTNPRGAKLVVSDLHKGFPEEWHGHFDVVHARLLVVVVTEQQIGDAVATLLKLLSRFRHFNNSEE